MLFKCAGLILSLYIIAPLISGMVSYDDPRGPIIYPSELHDFEHSIGRFLVGKPRCKVPVKERAVFYGIAGKPIDRVKFEQEVQAKLQNNLNVQTNNPAQNK